MFHGAYYTIYGGMVEMGTQRPYPGKFAPVFDLWPSLTQESPRSHIIHITMTARTRVIFGIALSHLATFACRTLRLEKPAFDPLKPLFPPPFQRSARTAEASQDSTSANLSPCYFRSIPITLLYQYGTSSKMYRSSSVVRCARSTMFDRQTALTSAGKSLAPNSQKSILIRCLALSNADEILTSLFHLSIYIERHPR